MREAAGLTQIDLAARSGLTHETISLLELGRRAPQGPTVVQLAQALAVAPTAFIDDDEPAGDELIVAEAARLLDVPAMRLRAWLAAGKAPGRKVGGQWRLPRHAVLALLASGRLRGRSRHLDPRWRGEESGNARRPPVVTT